MIPYSIQYRYSTGTTAVPVLYEYSTVYQYCDTEVKKAAVSGYIELHSLAFVGADEWPIFARTTLATHPGRP